MHASKKGAGRRACPFFLEAGPTADFVEGDPSGLSNIRRPMK